MIRIAHSPDADDFFMFWPIRHRMEPRFTGDFSFTELDTEDLNRAALAEEFDICAVSTAVYPRLKDSYDILSTGMSVGRDYGPVLVSKESIAPAQLASRRIGIPGANTTAALLLHRLVPDARTIEIPLTPYEAVFDALSSGKVDAAVLIHEGQIAYAEHHLHCVQDLGQLWFTETSLPLPLGINVIHHRLGDDKIRELSALLREAAYYALERLGEILPALFESSQVKQGKLSTLEELQRYLGMYANADSIDAPADCRQAVRVLLGFEPRFV